MEEVYGVISVDRVAVRSENGPTQEKVREQRRLSAEPSLRDWSSSLLPIVHLLSFWTKLACESQDMLL